MQEEFLYYIWKYRLFNHTNLETFCKQPLSILKTGFLNDNAGPDFNNAYLKIGDTLWVGNIEIHSKSSDWHKHNHHLNVNYDNVILHVVWENDEQIYRTDKTIIPTIELKGKVENDLILKFRDFKTNNLWIPCEKNVLEIDQIYKSQWLNRLIIERLEYKSYDIFRCLEINKNDWNNTLYLQLAGAFGFKINSFPFNQLAQFLPFNLILKYIDNPTQIEALVFGTAGFLNLPLRDEYPRTLQKEYNFLKIKHNLNSLNYELWKYSKLRPKNFPTIRLAQFASIAKDINHLFSKIIECENYKDIYIILTKIKVNSYWDNHYIFDKISNKSSKNFGKNSINSLIINVFSQIIFAYGKVNNNQKFIEMAFALLENMTAEEISLVKKFKNLNFEVNNALASQALIQLKYFYCDLKKCLNCEIGNKILNR